MTQEQLRFNPNTGKGQLGETTFTIPQVTPTGKVTTVHPYREPRATVLVGRIINGEWTTQGLHHFCEYCNKYMQGHDLECPHCGKQTL